MIFSQKRVKWIEEKIRTIKTISFSLDRVGGWSQQVYVEDTLEW